MSKKVITYKSDDEILAIVVKNNFSKKGMTFFTPEDFPQQLAFVKHKKGKIIKPHLHNPVKRKIYFTQEIAIIKKGKIKVNLYRKDKLLSNTFILESGDVIMFVSGGHGYEVLEDVELLLIKQGPYVGKKDKTYIEEVI